MLLSCIFVQYVLILLVNLDDMVSRDILQVQIIICEHEIDIHISPLAPSNGHSKIGLQPKVLISRPTPIKTHWLPSMPSSK